MVGALSYLLGRGGIHGKGIKKRIPATNETNMTPTYSPTSNELEQMIATAKEGAAKLKAMSAAERAELAFKCVESCNKATADMVTETIKYKGSYETGRGEETIAWSATIATCRELGDSLSVIAKSGANALKHQANSVVDGPDGRKIANVFPRGLYQHMLFSGYAGELWFHSTPESENPLDNEAATWLCLGAGNQATVVGCDIAHLVFSKGVSLICKLNPVNDYLRDHMIKAFQPLVDAGILQICCGGIQTAQTLIHHKEIDGIHMTGSDKTYDAIMWGPMEKTNELMSDVIARNKKNGNRNIHKPFMAELGASTPYIICPGSWSAEAIEFHARAVVSMCVHNGHFNCLAAQNIVVAKNWPQREDFLNAIRKNLNACQTRTAYYPGANDRLHTFNKIYGAAQKTNWESKNDEKTALPWTIIEDVSSTEQCCEHTCCNEAFTCVMTEITIDSTSGADFLEKATNFCNNKIWGTLSCSIFIPPDLQKESNEACEKAIANLKYGSVCVNAPTGLGYFCTPCTWGGYYNHTPEDIQSGIGQIHNTLMFKNIEKSVIRAPWSSPVTPMWFHDNCNQESLANAVIAFQTSPNMVDFTKVALAAVQG
eukprot:g6559.t1